LSACGDSASPAPVSPPLGRYAYQFSAQGLTASGTMVLTYASPDSIAGHFEVPAYQPAMKLGFKNTDAYVVYALVTSGGLAQHRLALVDGDLQCVWGQYAVSLTVLLP